MKKYIIVVLILLGGCGLIVGFSIPDRISYAINKMNSYEKDKYTTSYVELEEKTVTIDFSTYKKEPMVIYDNSEVVLTVENIVFSGEGYDLHFVSTGNSSFNSGDIIMCKDTVGDKVVEDKEGNRFNYSMTAASGLNKEVIKYTFSLYPLDEGYDMNKLMTLKIQLPINEFQLVSYNRE